jgi:hypothetical protein
MTSGAISAAAMFVHIVIIRRHMRRHSASVQQRMQLACTPLCLRSLKLVTVSDTINNLPLKCRNHCHYTLLLLLLLLLAGGLCTGEQRTGMTG